MDAQDKIKIVCECGYSTPPPECCNGSVNVYLSEDYHIDDEGNFILDELGNPIPRHICLCYAHAPTECLCGAWDDVIDWDC